ncbi:phosphoenolpyruvate synthase [Pseudomonas chlororaphis]|nr:phosphoenolpyruvate synthase [Pseudomonas chlororaphis]
MTSKYSTLATLRSDYNVPSLTCIDATHLSRLWENYEAITAAAGKVLSEIGLTSAAFIDEHLESLRQLPQPQWSEEARALVASLLESIDSSPTTLLAIRSSSQIEDGKEQSCAGIFSSFLNVSGFTNIQNAIVSVWQSGFSRAAVMEGVRSNLNLESLMNVNVIIQRMVTPLWAGVAFSHDPITAEQRVTIEAVPGLAESLVSGELRGASASVVDGHLIVDNALQAERPMLAEVVALVQRVAMTLEAPVDIEWAWDGEQLWLIQARPITSFVDSTQQTEPLFEFVDLYVENESALDAFKPLPDFAQYFRTKRKPLAALALACGVKGGTALLIRANKKGVLQFSPDVLMSLFSHPQVVMDIAKNVRQLILPKEQLLNRLSEVLSDKASTFVVRDYIRGEAGLITQKLNPASHTGIICEWSLDGLLAINRGTADALSCTLSVTDIDLPENNGLGKLLTLTQAQQLVTVTEKASEAFGNIQLEWVIADQKLCLIDFSLLNAFANSASSEKARTISPGFATGQPLVISRGREIEELSIAASVSINDIPEPGLLGPVLQQIYETLRNASGPMIIASPRPYAALASIAPFVAGFIFEQASILCHLAIILRERGIPAIESKELFQQAHEQKIIAVEQF